MADTVYILCALTSFGCAVLLARAYRRTPSRLLLWSSICFVGLALNSLLVVFDKVVLPQYDFRLWRLLAALFGLAPLLWALITDTD